MSPSVLQNLFDSSTAGASHQCLCGLAKRIGFQQRAVDGFTMEGCLLAFASPRIFSRPGRPDQIRMLCESRNNRLDVSGVSSPDISTSKFNSTAMAHVTAADASSLQINVITSLSTGLSKAGFILHAMRVAICR
ncbi:unnamed protein product [Protopolystoma xenopodis]|uniref:Uncharacterized protein n=1 Tax=Protopolystoma xenopodis TaxID=117903 RepID=A0A3S5ALF6_9PLAT|nr:unnamed protein product [Protopolystoma xenopodis]